MSITYTYMYNFKDVALTQNTLPCLNILLLWKHMVSYVCWLFFEIQWYIMYFDNEMLTLTCLSECEGN